MKRFRSIKDAVNEIREVDPKSSVSEWTVRNAVKSGEIPCRKTGRKYIVAVEDVMNYYEGH